MSLDGRLTTPPGEEPWITSPASRRHANRLRAQVDNIGCALVGQSDELVPAWPDRLSHPLRHAGEHGVYVARDVRGAGVVREADADVLRERELCRGLLEGSVFR